MGTTLFTGTPAREISYEVTQYVAGVITVPASAPPATVSQKIGTLPAGAVIGSVNTRVTTALSGGTPVFSVGTTPTGTDVVTGVSNSAGSVITVPVAALALPLAGPTDLYAVISGSPTAGSAIVIVEFYKPIL